MVNKIRKVMYPNPTFQDIEDQYENEIPGKPSPGLQRLATQFVLSPFYIRSYDDYFDAKKTFAEEVASGLKPIQGPPGPAGAAPRDPQVAREPHRAHGGGGLLQLGAPECKQEQGGFRV